MRRPAAPLRGSGTVVTGAAVGVPGCAAGGPGCATEPPPGVRRAAGRLAATPGAKTSRKPASSRVRTAASCGSAFRSPARSRAGRVEPCGEGCGAAMARRRGAAFEMAVGEAEPPAPDQVGEAREGDDSREAVAPAGRARHVGCIGKPAGRHLVEPQARRAVEHGAALAAAPAVGASGAGRSVASETAQQIALLEAVDLLQPEEVGVEFGDRRGGRLPPQGPRVEAVPGDPVADVEARDAQRGHLVAGAGHRRARRPGESDSKAKATAMKTLEASSGCQTGAHHCRGERNSRSRVASEAGQPSMTLQGDVVADVPHAEGEEEVRQPLPPAASGQEPDGQQHDDGRRLADLLMAQVGAREAEVPGPKHGAVLETEQPAQVVHDHGLDQRHGGRIEGDHEQSCPG